MRLERFIEHLKDTLIIPEYAFFEILGRTQSARNLIHRWCREGKLIRLKKGMYVMAERYRKGVPFLLYQIANNLVSPSYVSLDSALSFYGLIPERIVEVTSVCFKRAKTFSNDLGAFSYKKLDRMAYAAGIRIEGDEGESFLIADKEKTILDKIYFFHHERYFNVSYLLESLRMEEDDLRSLNFDLLEQYAILYPTRKMRDVAKRVRRSYGL